MGLVNGIVEHVGEAMEAEERRIDEESEQHEVPPEQKRARLETVSLDMGALPAPVMGHMRALWGKAKSLPRERTTPYAAPEPTEDSVGLSLRGQDAALEQGLAAAKRGESVDKLFKSGFGDDSGTEGATQVFDGSSAGSSLFKAASLG